MKRVHVLWVALIIATGSVQAQFYAPEGILETSDNDNVGINVSNPSAILHIKTTVSDGGLRIDGVSGEGPGGYVETPYLLQGFNNNSQTLKIKTNGQASFGVSLDSWANANRMLNVRSHAAIFLSNTD